MTDLIARIESADGPDRELDAEIARATGWVNSAHPVWGIAAPHWYNQDRKCITELVWSYGPAGAFLPAFTASIDAALMLVPEGWKWAVTSKNSACCHEQHVAPLDWAYAPTPALALCIAALRAQQKDTNA